MPLKKETKQKVNPIIHKSFTDLSMPNCKLYFDEKEKYGFM